MRIDRLKISDFRIIEALDWRPHPNVNLIFGDNGAGKTSILEAIYLLGTGQSFRHNDAIPIIRYEREQSIISAQIIDEDTKFHLAILRQHNHFQLRCGNQNITKRSELMRKLPVIEVHPGSKRLLEDGPNLRRKLLDLCLFHVEPGYHRVLARYTKCLKQYNTALRLQDNKLADSFLTELCKTSEAISKYRETAQSLLMRQVVDTLGDMDINLQFEHRYFRGWGDHYPQFHDALISNRQRHIQLGYCSVGPHRADMIWTSRGMPIKKIFSQGQQKMFIHAMIYSACQLIYKLTGFRPLLLVDDLWAELSPVNSSLLLSYLQQSPFQVYVTGIELHGQKSLSDYEVFHVKQGMMVQQALHEAKSG